MNNGNIPSVVSTLYKIKAEFPFLSFGRIMYYVKSLAEDRGENIHGISDDEFLDLIITVYSSLKHLKGEIK